MSSWNMGYHTDLLYTYGYYREINPLYAKFIFTTSGLSFPDMSQGTACELGFGQGVSIVMHAAGSQVQWTGTDFNPAQVNFAQHLAQAGNIKLQLSDNAFGDFAQRSDLPMFDFICLHGIWSWISRENQNYIVDFVRDHLKVGGVLYISYNVSPGFMTFEPVRHLMAEYNKEQLPQQMGYQERFKAIGTYLENLMQTNPGTLAANPTLLARIKEVLTKDGHYLSGEYLNTYWDIIHFSDMEQNLDRAKLNFACSATGTEHLDHINLTAEQQKFLAPLRGTTMYESTRDFMVYQQFRRDFFVKGKMQLTPEQKEERISKLQLILNIPKNKFSYEVKSRLGTAQLKKEIYEPVLEVLGDYKVHSFGEVITTLVERNPQSKLLTAPNINEALRTLVYIGAVSPAVEYRQLSSEVIAQCKKLNHSILHSRDFTNISCLASPVTQGGIGIGEVQRKLLGLFVAQKNCTQEYLVDTMFKELEKSGSNLNLNGKPVTDKKEQKKLLAEHIEVFLNEAVPMYRGLRLI